MTELLPVPVFKVQKIPVPSSDSEFPVALVYFIDKGPGMADLEVLGKTYPRSVNRYVINDQVIRFMVKPEFRHKLPKNAIYWFDLRLDN